MLKGKENLIKFIYGLVFGLASATLAFLLILQVCDIYFNGGASPYTVDSISEHFNRIAPFVYVWIGLVVIGFIVWEIFPAKQRKNKNDIFYNFFRLRKMLESKPIYDSESYREYDKAQWLINVVKLACAVWVGINIAFSLAYLCNTANFSNADQNAEIAKASIYLAPFVAVAFALCIGVAMFEKLTIKKQLPRIKTLISQTSLEGEPVVKPFAQKLANIRAFFELKQTITGLRIAVIAIGVTLIVYGLATGGNAGVLAKAITICRQCIGLG